MVKRHVDGKRLRNICQRTPSPHLGSCAGLFAVGPRLTAGTHEEGRDFRNFQRRPSRVVLPGLLVERAKAEILGIPSSRV